MLNRSCIGTIRSKVQFRCTVLVCKAQKKYHSDMKKKIEKLSGLFHVEKRKSIVSKKPKTQFLMIK